MICHFQNGSNYQKLNILLERLGRFKLNPKISKILQNASKTYSSATSNFQVHSLPKMFRRDFTQKSHFPKIFSLLHEQLFTLLQYFSKFNNTYLHTLYPLYHIVHENYLFL